jgi:6-phosphogluconate dehydrogenase
MNQLAVIGLGIMGSNLARNAARTGAKVAVYNRSREKTDAFMEEFGSEGDFVACYSYKEIADALERPRAALLLVKAGKPVDMVIEDLKEVFEEGDIIIDGGNSYYPDTLRRMNELENSHLKFLGMGISGGELGALYGPSMMPGGSKKAYNTSIDLLQQMAADDLNGGKCISYVGQREAGHFVKMVHNGIEYAIMQLIAESYTLLKHCGHSNQQISALFSEWNTTPELTSYLMEISAVATKQPDTKGEGELLDSILDVASHKGTGKWTVQAGLDYGVAVPSIYSAFNARVMSGSTNLRTRYQAFNNGETADKTDCDTEVIFNALYCSIMMAYLQGFELISAASIKEQWGVNLTEVARLWRNGCIIRSSLLPFFEELFNNLEDSSKADWKLLQQQLPDKVLADWRINNSFITSSKLGLPCFMTSLAYFDTLQQQRMPQNLIQAQRDIFGAHTYKRIDKEGVFHMEWDVE